MKVIALNTIHRTVEPGREGDKNKGTAPVKPKVQILNAGDVFETEGEELIQLRDAGSIRKYSPKTAAGEAKINALRSEPETDESEWDDDADEDERDEFGDGTAKQPQWDEEKQKRLAAQAIQDAKDQERLDQEAADAAAKVASGAAAATTAAPVNKPGKAKAGAATAPATAAATTTTTTSDGSELI